MLPTTGSVTRHMAGMTLRQVQAVQAASSNTNSHRLRERRPFVKDCPKLALKAVLREMREIHQNLAAGAMVDGVGPTMDAGVAAAVVIKRRRRAVPPLLCLRPRPPVVSLDLLFRPYRGGQCRLEVPIHRWGVQEPTVRNPSAWQDPCLVHLPLLRRLQRRRLRFRRRDLGEPQILDLRYRVLKSSPGVR